MFIYLTPCLNFVAWPYFSSASNTLSIIIVNQHKPIGDREYVLSRWLRFAHEAAVCGHRLNLLQASNQQSLLQWIRFALLIKTEIRKFPMHCRWARYRVKQADVCKTFTSRPFRIPGTPAPNYKNWDKRRTVNSKVLLGLGWATGGRSMFYKHLFLYLLNMLNLKNVIL